MKNFKPHHYKMILREISEGDEQAFELFVPALHAYCMGETLEEALGAYHAYFKDEVARREKEGLAMPRPDSMKEKTKQIPLRLPESLYERVLSRAKSEGVSFNGWVTGVLEEV